VVVAVALAALGVHGKTFEGGYPAIDITLGLLIGGVFLAAGLAVRSRPMHALPVAAGLAWLAEDLNTSDIPVVFWAGLLLRQATAGPLVHVILAHPDGRLPSRPARLAVTLAYAAGFGLPLLRLPITPLDASCRCPGNPFAITDLPALSTALGRLQIGDRTVESHVASIFRKLDLPAGERENRRVLAVLAFLGRQATE
jgi:hypothetical protein